METFYTISEHSKYIESAIASQLQLETPNHHVTSGTSRELAWLEVFENIIPKKFKIAHSVFLIDSFGNISAEIDLAIYDEQYTPYIFQFNNIQFIPIEAVVVVVQSKSRTLKLDNVKQWAATIHKLKSVLNAYTRIQGSILDTANNSSAQIQTATRPIFILCTLKNITDRDIQTTSDTFDFILFLNKNNQVEVSVGCEYTLNKWYEELNGLEDIEEKLNTDKQRNLYDLKIENRSLLTFKLQLNQLLMLINNPMFFPHQSYADLFKKVAVKGEIEVKKNSNKDYLLAIYDITGIQDYIFASNRMKQNAGASYIVADMVKKHFVNTLKECIAPDKIKTKWNNQLEKIPIFDETSQIEVEVVYIGGGNALVIYRNWDLYDKINRAFSLKVLEESASLMMVTEAIPFAVNDNKKYVDLYQELMQKLTDTKAKLIRTKLNQTLPIFAQEPFKGDAITHKNNLSTEQWLKERAANDESPFNEEINFVTETEDLKQKKGENSYIGVVHIDGNGMGEWIKTELSKTSDDIASAIRKHRELSLRITELFKKAFNQMLNKISEEFAINPLPMRPLILEGDDVTFICQGDLALPVTLAFLKELKNKGIDACAGIAFVHSHFPFNLAYEIAEQCCQKAKKSYYTKEKMSYFDFYVVRGSYIKTMIEHRETQTYLDSKTYNITTLEELYCLINKLKKNSWPRSRLIALYEAFLQDASIVQLVKDEAASRGYQEIIKDDRMLFDALQLLDFARE